jgi:uncharacterized protein (UPF0276 family)
VEAITENFLGRGGRPPAVLERVCRDARLVLHGVSLSIGSTEPLSADYLDVLDELVRRFSPEVVSDHLCFSSFGGHHGHDLWPLPLTEEALIHVADRVDRVQARLGRKVTLENPSRYVAYAADRMTEWEFLNELAGRTGCGLLLDVNNVYVSANNIGFSAEEYLDRLRLDAVEQVHLAGHTDRGKYLLDDHAGRVCDEVWRLFDRVLHRGLEAPVIVEWDGEVPELSVVVAEAEKAADHVGGSRLRSQAA